jgi:steroid delta-isomerase-like uncharacterized protein
MRIALPTYFILAAAPILFMQCAATKSVKLAEQNKETVRLWFEEGWNHNRNDELIERCFSTDWADGNPLRPNQVEGHDGMRQLVNSYRKAFPDAQFRITHLFADQDHVTIRYEVKARHLGEMFGLAPTGKEFVSTGLVLYEMEDGKIKTSWQELDLMGIINQLEN